MRGQKTITAMRMQRLKPSKVFVIVLDRECHKNSFMDAEQVIQNGGIPEVQIGTEDIIGTLDFRFLTGLTVLLQGMDINRLRSVFARLKEFDVERIVTSTDSMIHDYRAKK